jgi:glucan phosphoethanolaminetransferase (alkaline phosphatase superfamily)
MKSNKILNILIAAIAIIGGVLFIRIFMEDSQEIVDNVDDLQNTVVSPLISFSFWLFIIAVIVTIALSFWSMVRNPENLKKTFGGIAVLAVLLVIAYFLSDSDVVYNTAGGIERGGEEGSSINRWVGAGIWYSLILGGIAGIFFIVDLLKGLVKS